MRKITFRGKLSHSNKWVEGNLIIANNGQPYIIPSEIFEPDGHHLRIDSDNPFLVLPDTVSQSIGRTDKNGSEIYEDHKLKNLLCENGCYDAIYYTPRWDDENLCYMFDCYGYLEERIDYFSTEIVVVDSFRVDDIDFSTLEIIGSIHDNPELLNC